MDTAEADDNPSPWPQTSEGVTDWEMVFEGSSPGLIKLIGTAHTPMTLKDCATVVVQQLFTRDDDSMMVMKLIIDLEGIIPDADGEVLSGEEINAMRDGISAFLRQIKDERIKQAKEYLKKRNNGEERRR